VKKWCILEPIQELAFITSIELTMTNYQLAPHTWFSIAKLGNDESIVCFVSSVKVVFVLFKKKIEVVVQEVFYL
jgi:hypothetical protein